MKGQLAMTLIPLFLACQILHASAENVAEKEVLDAQTQTHFAHTATIYGDPAGTYTAPTRGGPVGGADTELMHEAGLIEHAWRKQTLPTTLGTYAPHHPSTDAIPTKPSIKSIAILQSYAEPETYTPGSEGIGYDPIEGEIEPLETPTLLLAPSAQDETHPILPLPPAPASVPVKNIGKIPPPPPPPSFRKPRSQPVGQPAKKQNTFAEELRRQKEQLTHAEIDIEQYLRRRQHPLLPPNEMHAKQAIEKIEEKAIQLNKQLNKLRKNPREDTTYEIELATVGREFDTALKTRARILQSFPNIRTTNNNPLLSPRPPQRLRPPKLNHME